MYHANQRQGTVRTLARGEVEGSTRKIFRQKGTGNARTGGIRNPMRKKSGGGHAKQKRPKDWRQALPKKARRALAAQQRDPRQDPRAKRRSRARRRSPWTRPRPSTGMAQMFTRPWASIARLPVRPRHGTAMKISKSRHAISIAQRSRRSIAAQRLGHAEEPHAPRDEESGLEKILA